MEQLDSLWIHNGGRRCESKLERTPATLGLTNMAGVFILVGAGIFGGLVLIIIEVNYKRYLAKQKRRMQIARKAAAKWRGVVEVSHSTILIKVASINLNDWSFTRVFSL